MSGKNNQSNTEEEQNSVSGKNAKQVKEGKTGKAEASLWPLYFALLTGAFLLLGDVLQVFFMWQSKARIGVALLMTALTMILARESQMRVYCGIIIWGALVLTFWL